MEDIPEHIEDTFCEICEEDAKEVKYYMKFSAARRIWVQKKLRQIAYHFLPTNIIVFVIFLMSVIENSFLPLNQTLVKSAEKIFTFTGISFVVMGLALTLYTATLAKSYTNLRQIT